MRGSFRETEAISDLLPLENKINIGDGISICEGASDRNDNIGNTRRERTTDTQQASCTSRRHIFQ
jgi:hypothetical protein